MGKIQLLLVTIIIFSLIIAAIDTAMGTYSQELPMYKRIIHATLYILMGTAIAGIYLIA